MARILLKTMAGVLVAALLLGCPALAVTVEQVQAVMPEIDVYLYENAGDLTGLTAEDVTASLDGEPLEVKELTQSQQGIFYVYMLDVSGSIPAAHFDAARQAIRAAYSRLREQDSLALIAFGDEVKLLLRGGETRTVVGEALDSLTADNANTRFYEAMDSLVELVSATEDMRRVAVVISDGDDSADDEGVRAELETTLLESGVSVSALCIDSAAQGDVEEFREIIEASGGELYTFGPEDAEAVLQSLLDRLAGGWLLCLEAGSNMADGRTATLSMAFGESEPVVCPVTLERWTPDTEAPRVKSAVYDAAGPSVLVTYSEPVSGADVLMAYTLSADNGPGMVISSVEAVDAESYRLMLSAPPEKDETLTLSIAGPADVSMEANPIAPWSDTVWSPEAAEDAAGAPAEKPEPIMETTTILILAGAAIVLCAAGVMIFRMSKKNPGAKPPKEKKDKKAKEKGKAEKTGAIFIFEEKGDKK